jgi:hypothetical protein
MYSLPVEKIIGKIQLNRFIGKGGSLGSQWLPVLIE